MASLPLAKCSIICMVDLPGQPQPTMRVIPVDQALEYDSKRAPRSGILTRDGAALGRLKLNVDGSAFGQDL